MNGFRMISEEATDALREFSMATGYNLFSYHRFSLITSSLILASSLLLSCSRFSYHRFSSLLSSLPGSLAADVGILIASFLALWLEVSMIATIGQLFYCHSTFVHPYIYIVGFWRQFQVHYCAIIHFVFMHLSAH